MLNGPSTIGGADATSVKDALDFIQRRRWLCAGVSAVILSAAILLAFRLPPVYLSQATILIEQPAIPEDIIPSTIRSYVDEQIQIVAQTVYSNESVLAMTERHDLYAGEFGEEEMALLVDRFVEDSYLENLTAEVTDERGRSSSSTFAFVVGFHHSIPEIAQNVTAEIAQRFLDENLQSRREKAATTTSFLQQESERLANEITEMETRIAAFKDQYGDALPGQMNLSVNTLSRTENELSRIEQELRELRADRQILRSEMSTLDPYAMMYSDTGEPVYSAEQRLIELRQEYLQLSSRYGPEHPDVKRTKREIEAIVGEGGASGIVGSAAQQRAALEQERDRLTERYSPEHPDVKRLQRQIDALPPDNLVGSQRTQVAPNNPAYLQAQARLQSILSGIAAAERRRQELLERRGRLESSISIGPRVEQDWLQLSRGYESARAEYEEIKRRTTGARLSENLEVQNKGERFTLLKRAGLPTVPVEPNRPAIIFLGVVLALGAAVGIAAIVDALDSTVRSTQDFRANFGTKPLATIPYVQTAQDLRAAWTKRIAVLGAAVVFFGAVLALT